MSDLTYIGIRRCGCVTLIISGDESYREHAASDIAEAVLDGYTLQSVTIAEAKKRFGRCKCDKPSTKSTERLVLKSE